MTHDSPPSPAPSLWQDSCAETAPTAPQPERAQADLLVIGGGFTGCSAALEAAQGGAEVRVLEAARIGHGGSGRNVGLVNAGLWMKPDQVRAAMGEGPADRLLSALGAAPQAVFDRIRAHDIQCEAVRAGTLHCAHAPSGMADLEDRFRQGNRMGAPLQILDAAEATRRTGAAGVHGALFDPRAGTVQPLAYCRGLARAAAAAGAVFHENAPALSVRQEGGAWIVRSPGGEVRAKALLLATNAYHRDAAGAPAPRSVGVHFSQFATAPLPGALRARIMPGGEGCWDTSLVMRSWRMDAAGRLILGCIGDVEGPGGRVHAAWARRTLAALFPEAAGMAFEHSWQGRIAMTGDHVPKVMRLGRGAGGGAGGGDAPGLAVFGYSGRGIGPGTVFGAAAARALLDGDEGALPLAPVDRHAEPLAGLRAAWVEAGATLTHALR
ncbi:NAD(P)/FAD-dependent oxidoreductase [Rhodovulum sp. DZ06]|uniref:NAD(P)/FAD-dependent oxidoreductase n=1 Tax=Rhodovulum sp. DZ06 TaxID=3425126 RepID=UPI003D358096